MGTFVVTEVAGSGTGEDPSAPVYDGAAIATNADASTSTTGEQTTTNARTRLLRCTSVSGDHRIQTNASANTDADSAYYYVKEGDTIDVSIKGGKNYVARLDA